MVDHPGLAIKRAERALTTAKGWALGPYGLTVTEYTSLRILLEHPGTSGAEVARQCLITSQAISVVFAKLEQSGLLERRPRPDHGATLEVLLTPAGRAMMEQADRAVLDVEARFVTGLSDRDIDLLQRALRRCTENLSSQRKAVRNGQARSRTSSIVSA